MKQITARRVIALFVGLCLWIAYLYENELAFYGLYPLNAYRIHELLSVVPLLCLAATAGWLIRLLVVGCKQKSLRPQLLFCAVLLVLCIVQGLGVHRQMRTFTDVTMNATVESIREDKQEIVIQTELYRVTLQCPLLVSNLLEAGQTYRFSYRQQGDDPGYGRLYRVQLQPAI